MLRGVGGGRITDRCKNIIFPQLPLRAVKIHNTNYYRSQKKFAKVVFTRVCHPVHGGMSALLHAGIPPPGAVYAGRYGQQAGGTHPTGMHSCLTHFSSLSNS